MILVNFGGPRDLLEISPFLQELLCDRDVIRTKLPSFLHNLLFKRIARKRSSKIQHDYELIGGKSPIFFDTEHLAKELGAIPFHRYLSKTHAETLKRIEELSEETITVLPLFPQFTFATSGSIARFFSKNLSPATVQKLRWIPSYPDHPQFISSFQRKIKEFLKTHHLQEEKTILVFSAHGLPQTFIDTGDPYQKECEQSFHAIMQAFPKTEGVLCFQSKFGRGEWLKPSTEDVARNILKKGRENIVFIPLSFTSDHIETLFEVEYQYMPLVRNLGLNAFRCPALNLEPYWIEALRALSLEAFKENKDLIYRSI